MTEDARTDEGAVAILVAILAVVLFGMGALAVDLGNLWAQRREMQTVADLAALAGAQSLPDAKQAECDAKANLAENLRLQLNLGPSEDPFSGLASDWATNTLPEDGEITILSGSGSRIIPPSGTCSAGAPSSDGARKIRVTPPERPVNFALAGVLGVDSTDVTAVAAAEIRTGLGVLPFVVGASVDPGNVCLSVPPPGAEPECPDPDAGNFGTAKVGRADAGPGSPTNTILARNMKFGLDHNPSAFDAPAPYGDAPDAERPDIDPVLFPLGEQCRKTPSTLPGGAIFDGPPWTAEFNCLPTDPGFPNTEDGLIKFDETGSIPCDGRIGASTGVDKVAGCWLTPDRWDSDYSGGGSISAAILDDPRFGFVPRVWKDFIGSSDPPGGGTKDYAIIGFYGAYITDFYVRQGTSVVKCEGATACRDNANTVLVKAELFDLDRLPDIYPNAGPTGAYIGYGPKIPVLVE